ncbi:leucine-rich repeat-containing protein 20-like [Ptychodera flava]|uniref:leucine-rich repeat-containing protein 20-like n=1 Tax=Ptychodera flava TaxID=63121 RepID=UPI00396A2650
MSSQAQSVADVTNKCRSAQEDGQLDLSNCKLEKVPDAIFVFFMDKQPESCNLSGNTLSKIPAKLGKKFHLLKEFIASGNKLCDLPSSLGTMANLSHLDLSHNAFTVFPAVIYSLPSLKELNVEMNHIERVDVGKLVESGNLQSLNVRNNPLDAETKAAVQQWKHQLTICYTELESQSAEN